VEKLSGKTALVTGSTDGVGRFVARKLGQAGARVLVHGRDAERGARVVTDIEASGGAADFLAADLSAFPEMRRLAEEAQARVDRLDMHIRSDFPAVRVQSKRTCGFKPFWRVDDPSLTLRPPQNFAHTLSRVRS
jgi:NAD(P)-dependent dehydrogenase (short-subunit alcohol dehydrogenase family)